VQLENEISKYSDFEACPLRDRDYFAGYDFFRTIFSGTSVCQETFIMDDTSCTNRDGFPILVILGIDEYKVSQLIAFALIRDCTKEQFVDFLRWFRRDLSHEDDGLPEQTPRAFVVDHHESQVDALQSVFPWSRIVFCARHLGAIIRWAMGNRSHILAAF
jgi:hypothetical protein